MTASLTDTSPDNAGWFTAAVAAELRAHMARQRVSGREVARRLHVSAQWISLRTKGASPMSTDEIERICDVLGITPEQLLAGAFGAANSAATRVVSREYDSSSAQVIALFEPRRGHAGASDRDHVRRTGELTRTAS